MEQIISFPKIGLEFSMDRVAFHLGTYPIYWYGILIATGFLLAIAFIYFRAPIFGLDKDRVFDVTFITIILGIIGARLYYVVFSLDSHNYDLLSIFDTTKGGLAIYGGIIFGVLGVLLGCKLRKVKTLPMFDLTVGGLLIGQAIGRWGNFTNVEAFGGNTSLPWGMTSPSIERYLTYNQASLEALGMPINPTAPVHPTFLYESLWCILGLLLIVFMTKRRKFDGQLTLFYFGWYGLGRFFIESLRTDSLLIGSLRVSQIVAGICFIASTIIYFMVLRKIKNANDPDFLPLYVTTEEAKLILDHKFYASDLKNIGEDSTIEETSTVDDKEVATKETSSVDDKEIATKETPTVDDKEVATKETPTADDKEIAIEETPTVDDKEIAIEETPTVDDKEVATKDTPTVDDKEITAEETPTVDSDKASAKEAVKETLIDDNADSAASDANEEGK